MFWKNKSPTQTLMSHRVELNQMATLVLAAAGVEFDASSQLNQALVGTFLFGMISAHGMTHKLTPSEVRALAIAVFKETLHYDDAAAAEGVQACIDASLPGHHDTMNAILHRGIDGHAAYVGNDVRKASDNLRNILAHFAT
jgi:hypothetical protein